ncbi:MAG: major facilitator superfamily protein [Clostridiales bacterium]|nr:major facilitator superfamily protein [Clostridiales bacterium]
MRLPKFLQPYAGLPKGIYVLFMVRVINSMGSFVFPLLTLLLTDKIGLSSDKAGIYVSLATMSYVPGGLIGGKLSDHFGRKKIMIISQGTAAILLIPCAFMGNSMLIPWILIIVGVLNGAAQPANSAMMADMTNPENRKTAFSFLYLGINIGFSIGPLIAGFLYRNYLPLTFLGNALASFISLTLLTIFVDESLPGKSKEERIINNEDEKAEEGSVLHVLIQRPMVIAFALLSSVYSFAYSQGNFSTTLQLKQLFGDNASKVLGSIYFTNGVIVVTMTTIIVYITKKYKPIFNVSLAGVFFACGFGMLYFISSIPLYLVSTVVWTIGEILNATNSGVYIANHAPMSHRGRFNSILTIITGAGAAIGPLIMGRYIKSYGVRMVWPLVFVVTMCSAGLMFMLHIRESRSKKSM